jgi:hypothetical protein
VSAPAPVADKPALSSASDGKEISPALRLAIPPVLNLDPSSSGGLVAPAASFGFPVPLSLESLSSVRFHCARDLSGAHEPNSPSAESMELRLSVSKACPHFAERRHEPSGSGRVAGTAQEFN